MGTRNKQWLLDRLHPLAMVLFSIVHICHRTQRGGASSLFWMFCSPSSTSICFLLIHTDFTSFESNTWQIETWITNGIFWTSWGTHKLPVLGDIIGRWWGSNVYALPFYMFAKLLYIAYSYMFSDFTPSHLAIRVIKHMRYLGTTRYSIQLRSSLKFNQKIPLARCVFSDHFETFQSHSIHVWYIHIYLHEWLIFMVNDR